MSKLKLRMKGGAPGQRLANGLVGAVYVMPAAGAAKKMQDVQIPVGADIWFTEVTVPPGTYMVEAKMPSGEILTEYADLGEKPAQEITFRMPADQENALFGWEEPVAGVMKMTGPELPLGWADTLCAVKSPLAAFDGDGQPAPTKKLQHKTIGPQVQLWKTGMQAGAGVEDFLQGLTSAIKDGRNLLPETAGVSIPQVPSYQDQDICLYRFSQGYQMGSSRIERQYALICNGGKNRLLSLPLPWDFQETAAIVELTVKKDLPKATDFFSLVIKDPRLSLPLAYLANDSVNLAADIFDLSLAREHLNEKVRNPLGATLGGYILLLSDLQTKDNEREQWHEWITNLKNWFPWLADGAIQYAWLKLDHRQNDTDVQKARDALLTACRRGLPYFTKGMSLLVDGLRLFKADGDLEAAAWLDRLLPLAWRADMSQVFLTVTLADNTANTP